MVDTVSDYYTDIRLKYNRLNHLTLEGTGMTDEEFYVFCMENPELRIERNAHGKIIVMPPTNSETGRYNSKIHIEIGIWNKNSKLGETFDSSTGFKLPNGADRSPDTAWIANERWDALPAEQKRKFAPIVPDFVLELRSDDQSMTELREKMDEYMSCGCRLDWLVDPQNRCTYVYSANGDKRTVNFDEVLSGGEVMPGLEVRLKEVLGV
ncbi:MAG TPA: Uma2 family endonuclease [Saprospiraceae bacterium]|nr:Uma2 family endonuclease [Saprospiraceae bacterium]